MTNTGRVCKVNGNRATIEVKRSTTCGVKCYQCTAPCSVNGVFVEVRNTVHADVDDWVEIETNTRFILALSFITYIVPILLLILGVFAGGTIHEQLELNINQDLFMILTGFLTFSFTFLILKQVERHLKNQGERYRITRKL